MTQEQHVLASDRVDQTLEPLHPVPATGGALTEVDQSAPLVRGWSSPLLVCLLNSPVPIQNAPPGLFPERGRSPNGNNPSNPIARRNQVWAVTNLPSDR